MAMTRLEWRAGRRTAIAAAAALVCANAADPARAQDGAGATEATRAQDSASTANPTRAQGGADTSSRARAQPGEEPSAETAIVGDLMWRNGSNGENIPWNQAREYCETLEHAGFDDWRLPTLAELETIHDSSADSGLRAPLALEDCCAWSSTNLVEEPAQAKGSLPDPANDPSDYYWGFLFGSGDRYYSFRSFPDGLAMCVREP